MFDPFRKIVGIKTKAEEQREREQRERAQRAERERRDREQLAKVEREKREKEQREQAERERKQREAVAQAERERKQREAVAQAERERKQREAVAQAKRERTQREAGEKAERERKQARATGINPDAVSTLSENSGVVTLAVLPNGLLASGSNDRTIKVWNIERGACEATLSGHTERVIALGVLPNGRLASGSADRTIKVWNIERGACEATLSGHTSYVFSLAVLPNGMLVSGADGKTIKVWDLGMHERLVQEKKLREEKERQERLAREQKIREEKERQEQLAREQKIREEKERQDNAERLRLEQEIIIKQVTRLSQPLAADRADAARILAGLALKTEHRMRIGQTSVISQLLDLLRDEDMDVKKHVAIVLSRLSINTNDLHKAIDAGIVSLLKGSSEAAAQNILRQIQSILDERYRADAPVLDKLKEHVINNEWRKFQVALSSLKYRDHRLNTSEGDTLLHLAIRHDRVAMVLELLKKDWHTTILNTLEQTSFDLARSLRNPVLLYVLKEIKSSEEVLTTVTRYIDEQSCSQLLFIRAEVNFELSKTVDLLPQKEGYLRNGLRDIERILRTEPSYTDASVLCERISHELDALALAKEAQKEEQRIKREHEIRQKTDGLELELSNLRCEWDAGNPRSLLERYQELLKQHAKNGALYRETGEFYAFQSNKAGVLIQKKGLYEKALNHFRKAIELDDFDFEAAQLYGTAMESLKALNISEKKAEPVAPSSKITDKRIDDLTEDQKKRLEVMKERRKAELLAQRDAAVGLSHACMFGVQGPSSASASDALSLRKN